MRYLLLPIAVAVSALGIAVYSFRYEAEKYKVHIIGVIGCQYLGTNAGGFTPLNDRDGRQVCDGEVGR